MLPPPGSSGPRRVRQNPRFVVPKALPVELDRRRVQDLLASGEHVKVALLVAPSGYGKTTALAQWARRQASSVVWLRLGEEDKDPKTLLSDLAQASALAGVSLENWDRASLLDLSREQVITALANDLNAHDADLVFVFDGGEYLGSDSARVLSNLITELGEGHRVLIAQHDASPFSVAPFLARGEGLLILADDLAFTPEDTRTVARQVGAQGRAASAVQEQYQGWPAGVMLALHTHQASTPVPGSALVRQLVGTLPDAIKLALPQLAVLDTWSLDEARHLGIPLPTGWLDTVQRAGLPLAPLGDGKFAPHDVIRELLTEQLKQDMGMWQALHLKVGRQAEASGQPYSAIRHYVQSGHEDLAMRLAEELLPRWYRAADWLLVREALEPVPPARLTASLRSLLALALLETGNAERGRELAQEQVRLSPTPTAHLTLSLDAFRSGVMPAMIEHIEAGLTMATEQRDIIQLLRFKAVYLQNTSQSDAALAAADEAVQRAFVIGDAGLKISALGNKGFVLQERSEKELALREYERAYRAGQELGLTNRLMAIVDQLAHLYLAKGRVGEASKLLEEYIAACQRNYPLGAISTRRRLANVRHMQGRVDEGVRIARQGFEELLQHGNLAIACDTSKYFFYTEVLRGNRTEAVSAYDRVFGLLGTEKEKLSNIMWIANRRMSGYMAYADGQWDEALVFLDEAASVAMEVYKVRHILTEMLRAEILWRRGSLEHVHVDALAQAIHEAPEDWDEIRMVYPHFEPLFQDLVRRGWHAPLFGQVLEWSRSAPDEGQQPLDLRLTTLGHLKVTLNGQEIRLGHSSAVEALMYLLLHPSARQDELADQVWGASDLKRSRQSAQTARNALNTAYRDAAVAADAPEPGDLIASTGRGRRNPEWKFGEGVRISSDVQEILTLHTPEQILRAYGGPFLPDSESPWVQEQREIVRQHVVRVLQEGAAAVEEHDPRAALAWLVRAADLAQTPDAFEQVIALAGRLGDDVLSRAAYRAIHELARGAVARVGPDHLPN